MYGPRYPPICQLPSALIRTLYKCARTRTVHSLRRSFYVPPFVLITPLFRSLFD